MNASYLQVCLASAPKASVVIHVLPHFNSFDLSMGGFNNFL